MALPLPYLAQRDRECTRIRLGFSTFECGAKGGGFRGSGVWVWFSNSANSEPEFETGSKQHPVERCVCAEVNPQLEGNPTVIHQPSTNCGLCALGPALIYSRSTEFRARRLSRGRTTGPFPCFPNEFSCVLS